MDERKKIREELSAQNAPFLRAQQGQVPGWELPDGYLDQLSDKVLVEVNAPPQTRFRLRIVRWAAAAVVVLAVGMWYVLSPATIQPVVEVDLSTISTEKLQQYVSENIDEFDLELLAATAAELPDGGTLTPTSGVQDISTEALEEYLEADGEWLEDLDTEEWF